MYRPNEGKTTLISKQITTTIKATEPFTNLILRSWLSFLVIHQRAPLVEAYSCIKKGMKKRRNKSETEAAEENMTE